MCEMKALQVFKALADESRLQIVALLKAKPHCVEDLAENLKLAESTISAHLKKLQEAGLVYCVKVQYYNLYHLNQEALGNNLEQLIPENPAHTKDARQILRDKVLKVYFQAGKVERLPVQNKKRWVVYQEIIRLFEGGRSYTEKEINEIITTVHEDYCLIRRELVEEGVLSRESGIYTLVDRYWEHPGFYQKIWMLDGK